jgi:hypothetical protein
VEEEGERRSVCVCVRILRDEGRGDAENVRRGRQAERRRRRRRDQGL